MQVNSSCCFGHLKKDSSLWGAVHMEIFFFLKETHHFLVSLLGPFTHGMYDMAMNFSAVDERVLTSNAAHGR